MADHEKAALEGKGAHVAQVRVLRPRVRRTARRRALWLLVVFLLALCAYAGLKSPYLELKQVQVSGGPQTLFQGTGLKMGQPLLLLDLKKARQHLLQRYPWIRSVTLRRALPSTLVISVARRRPVAVVAGPNGQVFGVDATGMLLPADAKEAAQFPFLAGLIVPGKAFLQIKGASVKDALQVITHLGALSAQTSELMVGSQGLTLYLSHGPQVQLGSSQQLSKKLSVLSDIRAHLQNTHRTAWDIDVRDPNHPAVGLNP